MDQAKTISKILLKFFINLRMFLSIRMESKDIIMIGVLDSNEAASFMSVILEEFPKSVIRQNSFSMNLRFLSQVQVRHHNGSARKKH